MHPACQECTAKCCRYFCLQIDAPESYEEFENIRWFLCHEGVAIHVDKGDWYIEIASPCKMLGADGLCGIYQDRPLICRKYSPGNCDHASDDYGYQHYFTTPEQIDRHARKTLDEKTYERQRAKGRGKKKQKKT